jgi:hypothetical protein
MKSLKQLIRESLLLEKRISQLSAKIEVVFGFDVDRTQHAYIRKTRQDIEGYDEREISNAEITYIVELARKQIAEKIITGEIYDEESFIIKSPEKNMAMSVVPIKETNQYWKLLITTVFRETYDNPFRVGKGQLVIWV